MRRAVLGCVVDTMDVRDREERSRQGVIEAVLTGFMARARPGIAGIGHPWIGMAECRC